MCKSEKARKIIAIAEFQADKTVSELARMTGLREHSIRHYLRQLIDNETISRVVDLNHYALGLQDYTIFFSLTNLVHASREQFVKELALYPKLCCLEELAGDFHYSASFYLKNIRQLRSVFEELGAKFGNYLASKCISTRIKHIRHGRKYLVCGQKLRVIYKSYEDLSYSLDDMDRRIVLALLGNNGFSIRGLARELMLPAATLKFRIDRLRKRGIISGWRYKVLPEKLGRQLFNMLIYLKRTDPALREELHDFFADRSLVTNVYECVADWDFQISLEAQNAEELLSFRETLYRRFSADIANTKTLTVLRQRENPKALAEVRDQAVQQPNLSLVPRRLAVPLDC